jgi:hypothetical protein
VIGKEEKVLKAVRRRISCDFMKGMPKSEHWEVVTKEAELNSGKFLKQT